MKSFINTIWKRPAPLKHPLGCFVQVPNFSFLCLHCFNMPGPSMAYFSTQKCDVSRFFFPKVLPSPGESSEIMAGLCSLVIRVPHTVELSLWTPLLGMQQCIPVAGKASAGHPLLYSLPYPKAISLRNSFGFRQRWLEQQGFIWRESGRCLSRMPFTTTSSFESRTSLLQVHIIHKTSFTNSS